MPVIPRDAINLIALNHMYLASHKRDIPRPDTAGQNAASDQEKHSLLTGNYIQNRIKMKLEFVSYVKTDVSPY